MCSMMSFTENFWGHVAVVDPGVQRNPPFCQDIFKVDFVTLKLVFKLFILILAILDYNNTLLSTFNTIPRFNYAAADHCQCHL